MKPIRKPGANPNHDFDGPIEKTSVELAKQIIDLLAKNVDVLIYEVPNLEGEEMAKFVQEKDEKAKDFGIEVMKLVASTDIPADYASFVIEKIMTPLITLQTYIGGSARQVEDEILSRLYGVKSPRTGRFSADVVTLKDKMLKLNELREATGNNLDDYFNPGKSE